MKIKRLLSKSNHYNKFVNYCNRMESKADAIIHQQAELLMAQKYHDTIADYEWLKYKGISPGGWAIDYAFCYTLARTLNAMKPTCILECGLGQSSRLIHQYASYYKKDALTFEHDEKWIEFLKNEAGNLYPINVCKLELSEIEYKGQNTLTYKGYKEITNNKKYNLLVVDGPFGSSHFSRSQAIDLCQNNLADSFCVIIDDTERTGEKETVDEIKNILKINNIDFSSKDYSSIKTHTLICSNNFSFLTSL